MVLSDVHSDLLTRDYKFFEAARKAAGESTFKVHVGAVAVWRGKVIAAAASQEKTHPLQKRWNEYRPFRQVGMALPKIHAEIGLLAKLQKLDVPMSEVKIYIYRTCKSRDYGMARPCPACWHALSAAGLKVAYYTTDRGFAKEWIEDYKEA